MEGGRKRRTHPDHLPCDDKVRGLGRARGYVGACAALSDVTALRAGKVASSLSRRTDATVCVRFPLWFCWRMRSLSQVGLSDGLRVILALGWLLFLRLRLL